MKRLAASFVVKFAPLFPSLVVQALDCLCDLLEDEDSAVRGRVVLLSVGRGCGGGGEALLYAVKGPVCTSYGQVAGCCVVLRIANESLLGQIRTHVAISRVGCELVYLMSALLQWNLSIEGTLTKGHLCNEDTVCSPNNIELCTNPPLN